MNLNTTNHVTQRVQIFVFDKLSERKKTNLLDKVETPKPNR